jgi:Ran-binding protein 3
VKKSRALSIPAEADENDNEEDFVDALEDGAPIPSPRPSSLHETEVCQPSQGVDDISGCNGQKSLQSNADAVPTVAVSENATPSDVQSQVGTSSPTPATTNPESQNQLDIVEASPVGEIDSKAPTGESAVPATAEPAVVSSVTEEAEVPVRTSAKPISQPEAQSTPEIDNPNQPHSHAADMRADSNTRETKRPSPPLSEVDGATKRPREDEDGDLDPNPREAKRASPPPEKEKEKEKTEKPMRKKSGSDAHAPSAPASPRSKLTSSFVGLSSVFILLGSSLG